MGKTIKLHRTLKPKEKYAINEQISMLPRTTKVQDIIKHLNASGISRAEFYADQKIEYGSTKSIPSDRLFIYAQVFDCPIDDLLNQQVKAKSIRQSNLKLKTSLK